MEKIKASLIGTRRKYKVRCGDRLWSGWVSYEDGRFHVWNDRQTMHLWSSPAPNGAFNQTSWRLAFEAYVESCIREGIEPQNIVLETKGST